MLLELVKFALFGLGNPGSQYFETRHNVGHWFLDSLTDVGEAKYKIDNLLFPLSHENSYFYMKTDNEFYITQQLTTPHND